jgi:hypothetical protein
MFWLSCNNARMIPRSVSMREASATQQYNFSISSIVQEYVMRTEVTTQGKILAKLF